MISEIPLTAEASQSFVTQLGDLKYKMDIRYNDRSGIWTLDLTEDASGTVLFKGVPMVVGEDMLEPYNYGIGSLTVIDTSSAMKNATAENLGTQILLYYVSSDEVLA